jgi:hypothetical protein
VELPVTGQNELIQVELRSDLGNAWAEIEVDVEDPDGDTMFETSRLVEYYYGYEDGENWSEDDGADRLTFRAGDPGIYRMTLALGGKGIEAYGAVVEPSKLGVKVYEGVAATRWLWAAAFAFMLVMVVGPLRRALEWQSRLKQGDWTDEDED